MLVVSIVGARPQFIKAAGVSRALREAGFEEMLVHTGQHYDRTMSKIFFDELEIPSPDMNLEVGSGTHGWQTGKMISRIEQVLLMRTPDCVLVYGDTNSTLAGAIAASKIHIPVVHVEAGVRSHNRAMPEEINRIVTDHVSDLLLCPSRTAVDNLAREGITDCVYLVGDIMAETLKAALRKARSSSIIIESLGLKDKSYLLSTIHRAENTNDGDRLGCILEGFSAVRETIVFPSHPRTRNAFRKLESAIPSNLLVIEPVGYLDMIALERSARLILTDSGGVQKEAYWLGVPCITLRQETEWPETVQAGWNVLAGTNPGMISSLVESFEPPTDRPTLYESERVGEKIVRALEQLGKGTHSKHYTESVPAS